MSNKVLALYIAVIVIAAAYLLFFENVLGHSVRIGGQDHYFSAFDIVTIGISLVALVLLVLSFMAYRRHPDSRMLMVSFAFLLFTIYSILNAVDNFFLGGYSAIGIAEKVVQFLVLLTFLVILFKK
ncbi:MAG: hypothetical protein HY513_00490 [Candidatus Aenigmarchaeota archaeon]|nr:hypothetical protein [Candidatus Aenigmarchaeota archaeon]